MAGTIVRVKRRLDDDPVEALVLSYKRQKIEQAVLTFAATVDHKDDETTTKAVEEVKSRSDLKHTWKAHVPDIAGKLRRAKVTQSRESRFNILSLNRAMADTSLTIVDVDTVDVDLEEQVDVDGARKEPQYVYDLYSTEPDVGDGYFETLVSIEPFTMELQYRDSEDSQPVDPYEDDSNDEDNWRNDYPDSDHSIDEDDMRLAASLRGMGIDDGVDLSSDSADERYQALMGNSPPRGFEAYRARVLSEGDDASSQSSSSKPSYPSPGDSDCE